MWLCFVILIAFQVLGEALSRQLPLAIPGPVIGMVLLFVALLFFPRLLQKIERAAMDLLQHLSLLFIPAGVGIMVSYQQVGSDWGAIIISMIMSTVLTMAVVALSFKYLLSITNKAVEANKVPNSHDQDVEGGS